LCDGWRRLRIAGRTIDLFETWTGITAAELDVRIDWIDSWYYHVRSGDIHRGTKVLRAPRSNAHLPAVWTVSPTPSVPAGQVIGAEA